MYRLFTLTVGLMLFGATVLAQESWTITGQSHAWSRTANAVTVSSDTIDGKPVAKVVHTATTDWAITLGKTIPVEPGDMFEMTCSMSREGLGTASPSVTLRAGSEVLAWSYAHMLKQADKELRQYTIKFVIPPGATSIEPRIVGGGRMTFCFDQCVIRKTGSRKFEQSLTRSTMENAYLKAEFDPKTIATTVTDKRTGRVWPQLPATAGFIAVNARPSGDKAVDLTLFALETMQEFDVRIELVADKPELTYTVNAASDTALQSNVMYPPAFASEPGQRVVIPLNEGISFPVEHKRPAFGSLYTYGGHGMCMAFFGQIRDEIDPKQADGWFAIVETPDDAGIVISGKESDTAATPYLTLAPFWTSQKGLFGYKRSIRYVFLEEGGHVAICKRYRQYVTEKGLYVPFTEKVKRNPNLKEGIDLLVGAANIWYWSSDPIGFVKELQNSGIDRILWSGGGSGATIAAMNAIPNVLTSRYDIYQDLMDPKLLPLTGMKKAPGSWTQDAFPQDVNWREPDGTMRTGWSVDSPDKTKPRIPCVVLCDSKALPYAEKRIGKELETVPYRARFLDTTVAAPWMECYNPAHPMTRTDSRVWKMKLLELMGKRFNLVCGSETGHEASVPYCDFYEGMMSLGPYRVPESGRYLTQIWDDPPERTEKYQVGEAFRLPLWELVYHDCTVSYWYWGDYNNKLPKLWRKRDLFNALYGVPPMYLFGGHKQWEELKETFVSSYKTAEPVSRLTGYSEMTDHRVLTKDRTVQRTTYANGVKVTVNFGTAPYTMPDGSTLAGDDVRIEK